MKILSDNKNAALTFDRGKIQYSFSDLKLEIDKVAKTFFLAEKKNCLYAIQMDRNPQTISVFLFCVENSIPLILLPENLSYLEIKNLLKDFSNVYLISKNGTEHIAGAANSSDSIFDPCALVVFSSGTSGPRKAIKLSAHNLFTNILNIESSLKISDCSSQLLFLPWHYSFGLFSQLLPSLYYGITTHIYSDLNSSIYFLKENKFTGMISGTPNLLRIIQRAFIEARNDITHVVSAGDFLYHDDRLSLQKSFPNAIISSNYGLTEATSRVLSITSNDNLFFTDATGYPVGQTKIKISPENKLLVKGDQVMTGYYFLEKPLDGGWLETEDLAIMDNQNGLVTIKGRLDNVLVRNGLKISISQLENLFNSHSEILHFKIFSNNEGKESQLILFLNLNNNNANPAEIRKKVLQILGPNWFPDEIYIGKFPDFFYEQKDNKISFLKSKKLFRQI